MIKEFPLPDIEFSHDREIINNNFFPICIINTSKSRELKTMKQIKLDMMIARDSFNNIKNLADCEENYFLKYSLWFTGTITYCRCFNSGYGRAFKLSKEIYINSLSDKFIEAHNELLKIRNKAFAHADKNEFENLEIIGIIDPEENKLVGITNMFNKVMLVNPPQIELYTELVNEVLKQIVIEEEQLLAALFVELTTIELDDKMIIKSLGDPDDFQLAEFYHVLSYLYCNNHEDYENGLKYIDKAIEKYTLNINYYIHRSDIMKKLGNFELQKSDLLKALSLDSKNINAKLRLEQLNNCV